MYKVSFVVTSYNTEKYIERCIKSITNQTLQNIEIIVVDDGSTDLTVSKIEELALSDNRISIIKQKNMGVNAARKKGFYQSRGEYIVFVDGDDWVDSELAEKTYNAANKDNVDIICYNYYSAYEDNRLVEHYENKELFRNSSYLELLINQEVTQSLWNKLFKREILEKSDFMDVCNSNMAEDYAACIQIAMKDPKLKIIDDMLYYYFQRESSTMNKSSEKILDIKVSFEYIEELLKSNDLYEKYREEIDYLWFMQCYIGKIINTKLPLDEIHKKLFYIWKDRNIKIKSNELCKRYMKNEAGYFQKVANILYNANYNLGKIFVIIKRLIKGI